MFFEGFELAFVELPHWRVRMRMGGAGPPLLLLHGHPQTHAMWHRVAPALARTHRVICPDLPGYGGSVAAASGPRPPYTTVEMARDMAVLMSGLGHARFAVGGHDRGARVAHRLALDDPERVSRLAVLDIVPTAGAIERTDMSFALGAYAQFWFAQPHPKPESLINLAPDAWFDAPGFGDGEAGIFAAEARADYLAAAHDTAAMTALCEAYRAAAEADVADDRQASAEGRQVQCPLLALWGETGHIGGWYDPLALWRACCGGEVTGGAVASGHYLAEAAPEAVIAAFEGFFIEG